MLRRSPTSATPAELEAYYKGLEPHSVSPLWLEPDRYQQEPKSQAVPHLWRWQELRAQLLRAGLMIGTEQAERRVLRLLNPGLPGRGATTHTLFAGLQLVMPGEIARAHRHTMTALRFVIEAEGGYTVVNGEKVAMRPGDLVLTPNWSWHDHANDSASPMIWLDGLDTPLVRSLEAVFYEPYPEGDTQPLTAPAEASLAKYGAGALRPTWEWPEALHSPLLHYPWERTRPALQRLADTEEGSAFDGVILEYTNPITGGPVLATIACYVQLLRPGEETKAHRHTASTIYHVVEGKGSSAVDGQRLSWESKDTFCVPAWAVHRHRNASTSEPAFLFSYSDAPVLRALGLLRERIPPAR